MPLQETARDWSKAVLVDYDIDALCLQASENGRFGPGSGRWIVLDEVLTAALRYDERRSRLDLVRPEATLQDKAAGYIPVERLDVFLALGPPLVACEML